MIPAAFDYVRATSVREAVRLLSANDGTRVIAGGQTLVPLMRLRLAQPARVLDIGRIAELRGVVAGRGRLRIGALATYRDLLDSEDVRTGWPLLAETADHIGDLQVRNRGTIAGGIAHADPASDMPAALLALGATVTLRSVRGTRRVAADAFFTGAFTVAKSEDELLTEIQVPAMRNATGTAYVKFRQPASGFALAGAAAVVTARAGRVRHATLAFTGLADHAFLAPAVASLAGTKPGAADFARVAAEAVAGVSPNFDIHAPAPYRLHLAQVAARRALALAISRA